MHGLKQILQQFGDVKINAPLSSLTTFKIGGLADFILEVTETKKLVAGLNFLNQEGIEYFILGGGSNVLLPDEGLHKVVIRISTNKIFIDGEMVEAEAGALFGSVITTAIQHNLRGLEWAAGLPGTVGGAARGNAGAMGGDMARVLEKVTVWRDGEERDLSPDECAYGYRESIFKTNQDVVLRAKFRLAPGDKKKSLQMMQDIVRKRNGHYPPFPSGGSFFKNVVLEKWPASIEGLPSDFVEQGRVPAGWLCEQSGLKSFVVGGAMVSKEHGNFLINYKNASQADVLAVVDTVKERVYNKFKVELEEEVYIVRS